ncbi:hypothetical protein [Terrimonas alba]|uniref:hypothetical protein n=1 Tax=Terrimonas alba TaxID=3349636 RepID=UPI0035F2DD49
MMRLSLDIRLFTAFLFWGLTLAAQDKTSFQISEPWNEAYDVRSDVVMVYGINDAGGKFEERVKGWRDKGYNVQFMTGIAWGQYKDYFLGQYDGKPHLDEGQVQRNGDTIWHGRNVPYIVPSANFLKYLKTHVKRAIDAGVTAIYLEEPEFWARAGYSESFKKEWQDYYKEPWVAQHESPEATYMSSKLKYHLYYQALKNVFAYAKTYSSSLGREVKCYVPTHSLLNYSAWSIVSPEASLASIKDIDGYIAQVWTGTSREPIIYNGIQKERVFENAFLEYGSMVSMTAPTGKRMYFLTDPIEDWPRTWEDYKRNYQATFTAKLLHPSVNHYEVMPWPNRIYLGKFKLENNPERQPISKEYATQMQVMVNSLNDMPKSPNRLNGTQGIGVLVSNSMMFQRFPTHAGYEDPRLSNFYGIAIPLLKEGIPVETVHMENLQHANAFKHLKVLVMSYANMKPLSRAYHDALNKWVRQGGILIYYGRDDDPFQTVKEWWNTNGLHFNSPSEDLFLKLDLNGNEQGFVKRGKGYVTVIRKDPKELVLEPNGAVDYLSLIDIAFSKYLRTKVLHKNYFLLNRGNYIIASVLDESNSKDPLHIKKTAIDLFDPELPVIKEKIVYPGEQAYLYNCSALKTKPSVLCAAGRIYSEKTTTNNYSFTVKSPSNTINAMRILLPSNPKQIKLNKGDDIVNLLKQQWDTDTNTLLLKFVNYSEGVNVNISW